tara:strand:+ start:766 stop:1800 length:1035 start_codon:yes stop_codon:yes gene_type:complete
MKKSLITSLHLGYWFCYLFIIALIFAGIKSGQNSGPGGMYIITLIISTVIVPSVVTFYSGYLKLFKSYSKSKQLGNVLLKGFIVAFLSAILGQILLALGTNFGVYASNISTFIQVSVFLSFIGVANAVLGFVIKGFITWFTDVKLNEKLTKQNHKMEIALIESKLNPHFLFNTINNIDVLIEKDATKASEYLNKLSDLLRFMLYETKSSQIKLTSEIEYINKYLDLQRIRSVNPNYFTFQCVGELSSINVAPALFIPIIENAFKHVSDKKANNAIQIELKVDKNNLNFKCCNLTKVSGSNNLEKGIGNQLIQKRLALLYPNKHTLSVNMESDKYCVELSINLND